MFEKILANLPYNPKLGKALSFYLRRIRQEESLRRLGLVFLAFALVIQFFAVVNPPKPSLAASTNDMINGGFSSVSELVADCNANLKDYATILGFYGIKCSDLSFGSTVSLVSTSFGGQLYSMGWNPLGSTNPSTGKITNEQAVNIPGVTSPLYWRYLKSWDSYSYSTYQAVQIKSSLTGQEYFILYACGNLVSVGLPIPYTPPTPAPTPTPTIIPSTPTPTPCPYNSTITLASSQCKPCEASLSSTDTIACIKYSKTASDITQNISNVNGQTAQAGDKIVFTLNAYNSGQAPVSDFVMQDNLSYVLDYANLTDSDGGNIANDVLTWPAATISPGATLTKQITVQVKNPIPQTPASTSDPAYFDHSIINIYGNTVVINLPQTPVTTIETTTKALPNTGPGDSLIVMTTIVAVAAYFLARSKLIITESSLAISDNNGGTV